MPKEAPSSDLLPAKEASASVTDEPAGVECPYQDRFEDETRAPSCAIEVVIAWFAADEYPMCAITNSFVAVVKLLVRAPDELNSCAVLRTANGSPPDPVTV